MCTDNAKATSVPYHAPQQQIATVGTGNLRTNLCRSLLPKELYKELGDKSEHASLGFLQSTQPLPQSKGPARRLQRTRSHPYRPHPHRHVRSQDCTSTRTSEGPRSCSRNTGSADRCTTGRRFSRSRRIRRCPRRPAASTCHYVCTRCCSRSRTTQAHRHSLYLHRNDRATTRPSIRRC